MTIDFTKILSDNHNRILAIARSYAEADQQNDLYQEIAMQIWRSRHSFNGESQVSTWVYRVAINTALTFQRKLIKSRQVKQNLDDLDTEQPSCHDALNMQTLNRFMATLNLIDKGILMMYLDDIGSTDIAATFGISTNAVYIRINRLKGKFKEMFID